MKNISVIVLAASVAFMAGAGVTYLSTSAWISDMANQPSIKPQERPFRPPERSVPTDLMGEAGTESLGGLPADTVHGEAQGHEQGPGSAGSSAHQHDSSGTHQHGPTNAPGAEKKNSSHGHGDNKVSGDIHDHSSHPHGPEQTTKAPEKHSHDTQAASMHAHNGGSGGGHAHGGGASMPEHTAAPKPIQATPVSIRQGEELFNIYCAVCHGKEGQGGMPMEKALADIPKFTPQLLRRESDPHMFSMVTSGHGPMPGYAEALMPDERWHVIHYLRSLQRKLADRQELPSR